MDQITHLADKVDLKPFAELARAGDKGIIVALILALIILMVVFAVLYGFSYWCEVRRYERREIDRDSALTALRIEENDSRTKLAETQSALTENVETLVRVIKDTSGRLSTGIDEVKVKVSEISGGVGSIQEAVVQNSRDIQRHEEILQDHTETIQDIKGKSTVRKRGVGARTGAKKDAAVG